MCLDTFTDGSLLLHMAAIYYSKANMTGTGYRLPYLLVPLAMLFRILIIPMTVRCISTGS